MKVNPEEIEQLIALKRQARAARRALVETDLDAGGAVVAFPVAVFASGSGPGRSDHFWSYQVSHEPGSVFPAGVTAVSYRGTINGKRFAGRFHVVVGEVDPGAVPDAGLDPSSDDPAGRNAPPVWAARLPANLWCPAESPAGLRRALHRAAHREERATEAMMASVYPFLEHIAKSFSAQIDHRRAHLDREDLINEGWKRAYQVLDTFSGPLRPAVPWSSAVYLSCRRDMNRALHALDGMSEAVATVRAACTAHPTITDPVALQRVLAVQAEERRLAARRPDLPTAERHRMARSGRPACPFSLRQIQWAMAAPRVVFWHDAGVGRDIGETTGADDTHLCELRAGVDDLGLAAVEAPVAAAARRLAEASGADLAAVLDVMSDLGVGSGGDPAAARLPHLRRRVLAPFILPGETPASEAVLRLAGHRARTKLFVHGELLDGSHLAAAWRAGISAAEAVVLDAQLAGA